MISKGFIKSSLIYTLAGALPMASAVILLPFYITYLSASDLGALSIYTAFSMLVQISVSFSFDTSLYIYYHEFKNEKDKLSVFVSSAFVFVLLLSALIGILFLLIGEPLFGFVFKTQAIHFFPFGVIALVTGIFQAVFKIFSSLLQSRQQPEVYFWSNLISFFLVALFTVWGLALFPNELIGPITGRMLALLISAAWALFMIFSEFGLHFNYAVLKTTFDFNRSAFIYQLQQWLMNYFDRVVMSFYLPMSTVGIYDVTMKCLSSIDFIINPLFNTFYPKILGTVMSQENKGSTPEINRYYHGLTAVIVLLVAGSVFVFPILIDAFIKNPDYRSAIQYIPYLSLIFLLRGIRLYFNLPYGALKYSKPLPYYYIIISASKIILIVLLIQRYEIYGVIFSSFVSYGIEIVLLRQGVKNKFRFQFNPFKLILAPLALALLILCLEPLLGEVHATWVHALYLIFGFLMLIWVYRNEMKLINPFSKRIKK